ncbi:MAG: sigma factor [bacterium]
MPEQPRTSDPEQWVDQYGEQLFRYALSRIHDRDAAEDVLQDTLLGAMNARGSFAGQSKVLGRKP